jgi:hypothetical protein
LVIIGNSLQKQEIFSCSGDVPDLFTMKCHFLR